METKLPRLCHVCSWVCTKCVCLSGRMSVEESCVFLQCLLEILSVCSVHTCLTAVNISHSPLVFASCFFPLCCATCFNVCLSVFVGLACSTVCIWTECVIVMWVLSVDCRGEISCPWKQLLSSGISCVGRRCFLNKCCCCCCCVHARVCACLNWPPSPSLKGKLFLLASPFSSCLQQDTHGIVNTQACLFWCFNWHFEIGSRLSHNV